MSIDLLTRFLITHYQAFLDFVRGLWGGGVVGGGLNTYNHNHVNPNLVKVKLWLGWGFDNINS